MTTVRVAEARAWRASSDIWMMVVLGAVAALVRILYWFSTRARPLDADALHYHAIALNIAEGRGISDVFPAMEVHPTAFRPPLFTILLGAWYRVVGPSEGAGRVLAVILGVALVIATYLIVRRHADRVAAVTAALLVAVFPPLVANDTVPLTETISLLIMLLLLDAVLRRRSIQSGLWCGLLTLARPSAQLLILLIVVWLVVKVDYKQALVAVGIFAAVLTPWLVRNAVQLGQPVLVTSNGFNLAAMHSAEARAHGGFIDPVHHPGFDDIRLTQFDEIEWDAALRSRALEDIRESPSHVGTVVRENFLAFFELEPTRNDDPEELDGRNLTVRRWTLPLFYVVAVAGMVGLGLRRRTEFARLLIALAVYFILASLVFVAPPRLRAPVDLVFCIGVGLLASDMWIRRSDSLARPLTARRLS